LKKITDKGISVEKMFYTDYQYKEDKILRAFKVRENINRISVVSGALPSGDNEVVLERRFAEVNNIVPGDVISVGGHDLSVCGIGAAPDYNTVYRKLSDTVVDSSSFGLFFVTPAMYDELLSEGKAVSSEEYYYAYKLNGAMTDDELRTVLEDNKFEVDDTDDAYFKEYWNRMTSDKDDLLEGIDELKEAIIAKCNRENKRREEKELFRLPVDRVFTMQGFGTVVTGTLMDGNVHVGDDVMIYPEGIKAKVRGIQTYGKETDSALAGQRTAINLSGISKDDIDRGDIVAYKDAVTVTSMLDTEISIFSSTDRIILNNSITLTFVTSCFLHRIGNTQIYILEI
jgi:putative ABC transport system permease protein